MIAEYPLLILRSARAGIGNGRDQVPEGRSEDALAHTGDEGRGTLRKAMGSCEQALIRGCPNGETRPFGVMRC